MQILVFSDIHANLTALETVLDDAGDFDAAWCLGDLVGYGPDPNECVHRIRSLPHLTCLMGNHDAAAIGQISIHSFNAEARRSIEWLHEELSVENKDYLRTLQPRETVQEVTLAHGSPRSPIYEYLLDVNSATQNFGYFNTDFCFVGHTHIPMLYELTEDRRLARLTIPRANTGMKLTARTIVNPGSVGQPRDHDPRAAFALFDPEVGAWEYRRIPYDVSAVQTRMRSAGLPERHIKRLELGW